MMKEMKKCFTEAVKEQTSQLRDIIKVPNEAFEGEMGGGRLL